MVLGERLGLLTSTALLQGVLLLVCGGGVPLARGWGTCVGTTTPALLGTGVPCLLDAPAHVVEPRAEVGIPLLPPVQSSDWWGGDCSGEGVDDWVEVFIVCLVPVDDWDVVGA